MIPIDNLRKWQAQVAWQDLQHVEQDLILSRILTCFVDNCLDPLLTEQGIG